MVPIVEQKESELFGKESGKKLVPGSIANVYPLLNSAVLAVSNGVYVGTEDGFHKVIKPGKPKFYPPEKFDQEIYGIEKSNLVFEPLSLIQASNIFEILWKLKLFPIQDWIDFKNIFCKKPGSVFFQSFNGLYFFCRTSYYVATNKEVNDELTKIRLSKANQRINKLIQKEALVTC